MNSSDLKVYKALDNGRISAVQVNSGVVQNVFSHVTSAQRAAGLVTYVKTWWKVADDDDGTLLDPEAYQDKPTRSAGDDDYVVMWLSGRRTAADEASLQAEAEATTTKMYGSALLAADAAAGATTIDVTVKHADLLPGGVDEIFRDADTVKICSHTTAIATDGNEEKHVLTAAPTVVSGNTIRLTIAAPGLAHDYTVASGARVSSLIPLSDVSCSFENFTVTTAGDGDYDISTYPLVLDNIGTTEEDISIDMSSATAFSGTGDSLGPLGGGDTGTDFIPVNADFSKPYFTLEAAGFSGTWAAGDRIEFTIHPGGVPLGQKRVVKAGAAALSNNSVAQVFGGETN